MNAFLEEQTRPPSARLRSVVRRYVERRMHLTAEVNFSLPIRPDLFFDFYLQDTVYLRDGSTVYRPLGADVILVGPHAGKAVAVNLKADIHYFSIQFQPTALHRLFGLPMREMVDSIIPTRDVLGPTIQRLRDAVLVASDFYSRIIAAEHWLAAMLDTARPANSIDAAAHQLRRSAGSAPLQSLMSQVALSERQWRRRFEEQTGLPPKLYGRIARLDATLESRRLYPTMSWAEIAHRSGYTDQSHMLRDAKALLGTNPATWLSDPDLGSHALAHLQSPGAMTLD